MRAYENLLQSEEILHERNKDSLDNRVKRHLMYTTEVNEESIISAEIMKEWVFQPERQYSKEKMQKAQRTECT